ncbi:hypothetical protein AGMMS49525_08420 [Bacteroidia bacterium]|nr:hypothetical protein AGMMS49525_08420 [Bacteroidia bacterium]
MSRDMLKKKGRDTFLFGGDKAGGGPLWYRGMTPDLIDKGKYTENPTESRVLHLPVKTLQSMLQRYNINRVILMRVFLS